MANNSDKIKKLQNKIKKINVNILRNVRLKKPRLKRPFISWFKKVDQDPNNYHHYYDLATFLVEAKDYEQAEELLMKALGLFDKASQDVKNTLQFGLGNVIMQLPNMIKQSRFFKESKIRSCRLNHTSCLPKAIWPKATTSGQWSLPCQLKVPGTMILTLTR